MKKIPVVAVVGPTASGKTSLAVEIAERFSGQVVSADSMQIYENMNIATAKPTDEEMKGIKHHLIGFQPVGEKFSVARYVSMASECIRNIYVEGFLPIVAGGTGLYVDSLLENITFSDEKSDGSLREELTREFELSGAEYMLQKLREIDMQTASKLHINDKSRIIRALEVYYITGKTLSEQKILSRQNEPPYNTLYIGINYRDRSILYDRINRRVDIMLENGLLDEARDFYNISSDTTSCQAIGYKELAPFIKGESQLCECVEKLKAETRHYAKRQLTWFRKNGKINWFFPDDYENPQELYKDVFDLTDKFLKEI